MRMGAKQRLEEYGGMSKVVVEEVMMMMAMKVTVMEMEMKMKVWVKKSNSRA